MKNNTKKRKQKFSYKKYMKQALKLRKTSKQKREETQSKIMENECKTKKIDKL